MIRKIACCLALAISLIMNSCAEKTAYIVAQKSAGGDLSLTDISKAKSYFKMVLEHAKIQDELKNFEILTTKSEGDTSLYLLRAHTTAKNIYMAIEVFDAGRDQLGITSASLTQGVLICNAACPQGCIPVKSDHKWSCSNSCDATTSCQEIITRAYEENNYTTPIQAFLERY